MDWKERLAGAALRSLERVLRPASKRRAGGSKNFLLLQFQTALGTVVHATPVVEALKSSFPSARIAVASTGLARQVWEGNPHLERLIEVPSPLKDLRGAVLALRAARLFDGQPFTTLLTTGNERTKVCVAAMLARSGLRLGFAVHPALLDKALEYDPEQSQIANNLRLLPLVGGDLSASFVPEPKIYPPPPSGEQLLPAERSGIRIALATQTSVTQLKKWRDERWIELALALHKRYAAELVFIGTQSEAAAIDNLRERIPFETVSLAGRTTVRQLAATLQNCDLGIMLDTGPLHVGRSVQLPIVVIAPGWSPAHEWLPVAHPRYRILKKTDFPPPVPADYIIDEVSVADVLEAASELLCDTASPFTAETSFVAAGRTPEN